LHALNLDNLALVFSGGIAAIGLAMGVGGSALASDVLSGVFLAQDKDFNIGDFIRAGDPPVEGVLESMDMRRTRITDKDGKLHVIPNSVIERKEWVVLTRKRDME
jgi:small-conductance mechanosensitive channel